MPPRLAVLSGPSGVGKGTVVARLRELVPQIWVSVSATTRAPRPGEVDGVQYHFRSVAEFERMAAAGELLEHARFAGNCYGTPKAPVLEQLAAGHPTLLEIDLQGARRVRAQLPGARLIFLAPPSLEELVQRLTRRGTESAAEFDERMRRAEVELAAAAEFDHVVVNDELDRAAAQVAALVTAV
jgi:guanylate kinase